jgi:hypothetical protein
MLPGVFEVLNLGVVQANSAGIAVVDEALVLHDIASSLCIFVNIFTYASGGCLSRKAEFLQSFGEK